jgi:hypothetical protein
MGFGVVLSDGKQDTQNYIVWKKEKNPYKEKGLEHENRKTYCNRVDVLGPVWQGFTSAVKPFF